MIAMLRLTVAVDRLCHVVKPLPLGIWLPLLACITVIGCAPALPGGPRSGGDPQTDSSLRTRMVLGDKNPALNGARARMLRHEYLECQVAQRGLRRAQSVNDPRQVALWQAQSITVRASYDLIAAQSADQVFAITGLPRRF